MYPTLAKAGAPGRLSPVATDFTVPRMRPTIRPDVSATCHVEIKQTISGAWGKKQPTTSSENSIPNTITASPANSCVQPCN